MKKLLLTMLAVILMVSGMAGLSGCGQQSASGQWSGPSGIKVPWGDYEEELYSLTVNNKATDDMKYIIEKSELEGKSIYKMQFPLMITDGEYNSGAVLEADTLKPVSSFFLRHPPEMYKDKRIDIAGQYKEKLDINAESSKGKQNWQLKLSGECVDNESIPMVIRAFPLEEGFKKVVNIAILSTVKIAPFEVRVTGKEKVKVPAGEYDCYKVELQYKGLMPAPALNFWYSDDDKKLMVKSVQGTTVFELKEVKEAK